VNTRIDQNDGSNNKSLEFVLQEVTNRVDTSTIVLFDFTVSPDAPPDDETPFAFGATLEDDE
jgi:hypothetical protein